MLSCRHFRICVALLMAPVAFSESKSPLIGTWTNSTVTVSIDRVEEQRDVAGVRVYGSIRLGSLARDVYGIAENQPLNGWGTRSYPIVYQIEFGMRSGGSLMASIRGDFSCDARSETMSLTVTGWNVREGQARRTVTLRRSEGE
jgi:hypothetical protein